MAAVREERIPHKKITGMIRSLIKTLRFYGNGLNPFHGRATVVVSRKTGKIVSKFYTSSAGRRKGAPLETRMSEVGGAATFSKHFREIFYVVIFITIGCGVPVLSPSEPIPCRTLGFS